MARNMSGKILNSAAFALALSSTAPPTSMRMPGGSVAAISSIAGMICAVTSGACTPGAMSERTVSTTSRLRRHRMGSSNS